MMEKDPAIPERKAISDKTMSKLHYFGSKMAEILAHSLAAPDRTLRWTIIANPCAGGFTISRRWKKHENALNVTLEKALRNSERKDAVPSRYSQGLNAESRNSDDRMQKLGSFGLIPTAGPGHAMEIARAVLNEMAEEKDTDSEPRKADFSGTFHLIITAGGDGTSLEVMQILSHAAPELRSKIGRAHV